METKELEQKLGNIETELKKFIEKHAEEVKTNGAASTETKATLDKIGKQWTEVNARLLELEQKSVATPGGTDVKTIGEKFVESDAFKAQAKSGRVEKVQIGDVKTAIVNATGQNQPLVPDMRVPGVIGPGLRRLTVRDLLPNLNTSSNLVQFARELLYTNNAAPVSGGSPNANENATKPESALTFELANAPVQTVAHWIPASRQILDDAPALAGYINTRLMYGLKLAEESQLLNGSGSGTNISGLITNSTAMDTSVVNTSTDTYVDVVRRAITQVELSYFEADAIIMHPRDWETIELTKETGTGISSGMYVFTNPRNRATPTLWGLNVVPTQSIAQGQFLVGAFGMGAALWDRQDATIEVSREHASYFVQNMVAILCEERLALTVFRPLAFVYGGFPFGS